MAADDNTEGQSQKKRAMPDFVKDALAGKTRVQNPKSFKPVSFKTESVKEAHFMLPFVADGSRIVPDAILRSALFGVSKKRKNRPFLKEQKVASIEGIEVFLNGEQLDQGDLDVWETLLHVSSHQALGTHCQVTEYQLLKLLGLSTGGNNRNVLMDRIKRLTFCSVIIKGPSWTYMGGLLHSSFQDEHTKKWRFSLNPEIVVLFEPTRFSQVDWQIRQSLKGQLAQWLHGFYSSHAKPHPIKTETLHRLCGSEIVLMKNFRTELIKALNSVSESCNAHDQPFSYELIDGLVYVKKTASKTQKRHLETASSQRKPNVKSSNA